MAITDEDKPEAKKRPYKWKKKKVGAKITGRLKSMPVQPRFCYHCGMPQPREVRL